MLVSREEVLGVLSNVKDPDLGKDLVSLNMIKDLKVDGKKVYFTVELTTPACPLKELIRKDCEKAVLALSTEIELEINMSSSVTTSKNSAAVLPNVKNIIAVASGKGGVGKSTVTSNLAVTLAKTGAKVGIIDADIFGPSMPVMFNCENERPQIKKVGDKNYILPIEQYGVKILSIGFLAPAENAIVWRGPMASSALRQFFTDAEWGELDYLLIDLPPGTSDIHLTLVQTVPVTGAVIVTTPQKVAIADAVKGIAMFKQGQINVPILGIIENMAFFTPEELPNNKYYIFGKDGGKNLAEKNEVPFLGEVPIVQSIRESGDAGYPVVLKENAITDAFETISQKLAQQIAIRNANFEKTAVVEFK